METHLQLGLNYASTFVTEQEFVDFRGDSKSETDILYQPGLPSLASSLGEEKHLGTDM